MSVWKGYIFIVGILVLIGTVSALMPDIITISNSADSDSHNGWLVANGTDQATITIKVENLSSSQPVVVATVVVSVDPFYGSFTNTTLVTNSMGIATTVFRTNKTSIENLIINVTAFNAEGGLPAIKNLKIDHDQAYYAYFDYQSEVVVDQTTPFIVTLKDRWGNRVDKKNPSTIHIAKFYYYPPPKGLGTGGLKNATSTYLTIISDSTDYEGNISLTAKVDTVAGENNIWMEHIEKVPDKYPFIVGITQAPPYFIDSVVNPGGTPPAIPADMVTYFTIIYTLRDRFGNPSGNQTARIFTSDNESIGNIRSNSLGQIWVTYGPKSESGEFNITAVAIENATVSCSDIVKFYSTDPVYMVVTANPQTMPSRDVPASQPAEIIAKVMDEAGNPSESQDITFTLLGYTNTTVFTTRPSFSSSTYLTIANATTDANGTAIVNFYPGEFPVSGPYYNSTATGTANVIATWRGNSTPITLTFKNYPYLRIETSVNPKTVNVSGTFDVDIKLIGDGWKLQGKPIDAVLCTDRSGSMLYDNPDRMYSVREAAKQFVNQMTAPKDLVGLVTFGRSGYISRPGVNSGIATSEINNAYSYPKTYSDYATVDRSLTTTFSAVKTALDNIVPDHGTPMRSALYKSVNEIKTGGRSGTVKAIILLSDGDYNWYGDPLARGTGTSDSVTSYGDLTTSYRTFTGLGSGKFSNQNMSVYAANNAIKIYSIGYAESISSGGKSTLRILAEGSGGKYFDGSAANIADIYKTIAGELKEMAGVNTQMNLNFQNVNVTFGNVTTSMPGQQVFDYNYTQGESTWVTSWNGTMNPLPDQVPKPSYPNVDPDLGTYTTYPYSFDQRNEWLSSSALNFNAGNISVNQTWETKFRFRVNKSGIIEIFGPGSKIVFNNGESTIDMPRTYISVLQNMTNYGINSTILDISDLHTTAPGVIKDFIPLEWQVKYDGNQTVTERVSYSNNDGHTWVLFDTNYVTKNTLTDYSSLDVRLLPPGEYWIRVDATALDAPSDREMILEPITVGTAGRSYIKLE